MNPKAHDWSADVFRDLQTRIDGGEEVSSAAARAMSLAIPAFAESNNSA